MTMVDDDVSDAGLFARAYGSGARRAATVQVVCVARPGSGLVHLDGPCQCFFGGPAPVFLDGPRRTPGGLDGRPAGSDRAGRSHP